MRRRVLLGASLLLGQAGVCDFVCIEVGAPPRFPMPLCLPFRSLKQLPRTRSSQSFEPWRRRDVPRAGRPPRRRAARGRPSGRPSAARRGAGRSAVRAGASPRRVATMPEASVPFAIVRWCRVSKFRASGVLNAFLQEMRGVGRCRSVWEVSVLGRARRPSLRCPVPRASEVLRGQGRHDVKIHLALDRDLRGGIVRARNSRIV